MPLLFLGVSMAIQYHDKAGKLMDTVTLKEQNCWFLDRNAFIYGHVIPSFLILMTTFYYLLRSAFLARYIISMQADIRVREKLSKKRTLQIFLFAKLIFVLVLVLCLGTATKLTHSNSLWIAYHIAQGLQGILVAMLVTCNCHVLKLYTRSIKLRATKRMPCYVEPNGKTRKMNSSTSMQLLTWDTLPDTV